MWRKLKPLPLSRNCAGAVPTALFAVWLCAMLLSMIRRIALAVLLLAVLTDLALAVNVVGTWVVDPKTAPKGSVPAKLELTFRKDGTISVIGPRVSEEGSYQVIGKTLKLVVTRRNGVALRSPKEASSVLTISNDGSALLGDSGVRIKGKAVMMRLIRKRK